MSCLSRRFNQDCVVSINPYQLLYRTRVVSDFILFTDSSILHSLSMIFLFVSATVCVQLPSDSTSQWTPLSFANSFNYQACNGLSPSRCYPCWAGRTIKRGQDISQSLFVLIINLLIFILKDFTNVRFEIIWKLGRN